MNLQCALTIGLALIAASVADAKTSINNEIDAEARPAFTSFAKALRTYQELPADMRKNAQNPAVYKALTQVRQAVAKLGPHAEKMGLNDIHRKDDKHLVEKLKVIKVADTAVYGDIFFYGTDANGGLKTLLLKQGESMERSAIDKYFEGCTGRGKHCLSISGNVAR
jgi:hypothetical protein